MVDDPRPGDTPEPAAHPRVARRRYLIDPKRQLRTTLLTTSLVAILLLAVNLGFALLRGAQTSLLAAAAPRLTTVLEEQNSLYSLVMIVISAAIVAAVGIMTIIQTHRTAGAVFAVRQRLERVRQGDLHVTLKLRRQDNLQDLETPFNEMVSALRSRALAEAETLDQIATNAEAAGDRGGEIAETVRGLARAKRQIGT